MQLICEGFISCSQTLSKGLWNKDCSFKDQLKYVGVLCLVLLSHCIAATRFLVVELLEPLNL